MKRFARAIGWFRTAETGEECSAKNGEHFARTDGYQPTTTLVPGATRPRALSLATTARNWGVGGNVGSSVIPGCSTLHVCSEPWPAEWAAGLRPAPARWGCTPNWRRRRRLCSGGMPLVRRREVYVQSPSPFAPVGHDMEAQACARGSLQGKRAEVAHPSSLEARPPHRPCGCQPRAVMIRGQDGHCPGMVVLTKN